MRRNGIRHSWQDPLPLANNNSTQLSHSACPQTLTINFIDGFRYLVVLHIGQTASMSMVVGYK